MVFVMHLTRKAVNNKMAAGLTCTLGKFNFVKGSNYKQNYDFLHLDLAVSQVFLCCLKNFLIFFKKILASLWGLCYYSLCQRKNTYFTRRSTQVWLKGAVLKTARGFTARGGSNPSSSAIHIIR